MREKARFLIAKLLNRAMVLDKTWMRMSRVEGKEMMRMPLLWRRKRAPFR